MTSSCAICACRKCDASGRLVDLPTTLHARRRFPFPGELPAHRKGMARVGAFPEAILPVIRHAQARRGEGLVSGQGLHGSLVIVASPKEQVSLSVADLWLCCMNRVDAALPPCTPLLADRRGLRTTQFLHPIEQRARQRSFPLLRGILLCP